MSDQHDASVPVWLLPEDGTYFTEVAGVIKGKFPTREAALEWAYQRLDHATERNFQDVIKHHDAAVEALRQVPPFLLAQIERLEKTRSVRGFRELAETITDALGPHQGYLTQLDLEKRMCRRTEALLKQQTEEVKRLASLLDQKTSRFTSVTTDHRIPLRGFLLCPLCTVRGVYVRVLRDLDHSDSQRSFVMRCRACGGVRVTQEADWIDLPHALACFPNADGDGA